MAYTVKIVISDNMTRQMSLHNLSAVWGFLCGAVPTYGRRYPTFLRFKQWWTASRDRDVIKKTVNNITFEITR